ncbi:MAG TPA: AMP-binding protein [Trueperaceae bacterium]
MNLKTLLMPAYRRVPPGIRNLASSVWGRHLYSWRYGPETDRLVAEATARETWDAATWQAYVQERLAEQLSTAARSVPYYRDWWSGQAGDAGAAELASWPFLPKQTVRERAADFRRDDLDVKKLYKLTTSGTTGTPLTIWRSRATMRAWYALSDARWRRWYGVSRHDNWALMAGQEVVPTTQDRPPFWVWNTAAKQLYMSTVHLKRENAVHYLEALRAHEVRFIDGYPSMVATLARFAVEEGLDAPRLQVVVTHAETLTQQQRDLISQAFGCPVRNTYGMGETVVAASECEHGAMHIWPEVGYVEVYQDLADAPAAPGTTGRLVATGLLNKEMPLIRYEVGDRGAVDWTFERCACGRTLPRLTALEGRTVDNLVTADGRRVFATPGAFFAGMPIVQAQVIQEAVGRVRIRLIPAPGFEASHAETIQQRVRRRLGDISVEVERVSDLPRGPNGKLKGVVNLVGTEPTGAPQQPASG